MSSLIDELRDRCEREIKEQSDRNKHFLDLLKIALQAIRESAVAGNVRCNLAMTDILTKENEYRKQHQS